MNTSDNNFDPFQVFTVEHKACLVLHITVVRGIGITNGFFRDLFDCPDPFVLLKLPASPTRKQQTTVKNNNRNPIWNESFIFLLDDQKHNILDIILMESNIVKQLDTTVGEVYFDLRNVKLSKLFTKTFEFNGKGKVIMEFLLEYDSKPDLRYSLCLCEEEKQFRDKRRRVCFEALHGLLSEKDAPKSLDEVPVIAVMGSGGGFRAMTAFSGVMTALEETGVIDCVTYNAALSGSSWYLGALYSHPDYPYRSCKKVRREIRQSVQNSLLRFLNPTAMYKYLHLVWQKKLTGQPVSFTDLFGYMIGETLLKNRMNSKLSDQKKVLSHGTVPMPLYSGLNVKKDVAARLFQEWIEFNPYEIGMPKYGCFLKTDLFGCNFYMGRLCKYNPESPLHFLLGIWGSAFTAVIKEWFAQDKFDSLFHVDEFGNCQKDNCKKYNKHHRKPHLHRRLSKDSKASSDITQSSGCSCPSTNKFEKNEPFDFCDDRRNSLINIEEECKNISLSLSWGETEFQREIKRVNSDPPPEDFSIINDLDSDDNESLDSINSITDSDDEIEELKELTEKQPDNPDGWFSKCRDFIFGGVNFLNTRSGRAAVVHSFLRSLSLQQKSYPIAPFTPSRLKETSFVFDDVPFAVDGEYMGIFEKSPVSTSKHMLMVDAGLAFNSPYPLVLRQQRGVDLILSFDFSRRKHDNYPPLKEILLAYKWALLRNVPFPRISMEKFLTEGMQEVYIFQDKSNPRVPMIMHFVLVNQTFRQFKSPGVKRKTEDEIEFANFSIFTDPSPYSTFKFVYSNYEFDRLAALAEYNTKNHLEDIKSCIAACIKKRRRHDLEIPLNKEDMGAFLEQSIGLGMQTKSIQQLSQYIQQKEEEIELKSSVKRTFRGNKKKGSNLPKLLIPQPMVQPRAGVMQEQDSEDDSSSIEDDDKTPIYMYSTPEGQLSKQNLFKMQRKKVTDI